MNLAFKLHKPHENHTKNANKIHTYQLCNDRDRILCKFDQTRRAQSVCERKRSVI